MKDRTRYPTLDQVNAASRIQICAWWRFLASPADREQKEVMDRIVARYQEMGGFTAGISKALGWES